MLLSIIGELRVGTSPRRVMATRLIVPETGQVLGLQNGSRCHLQRAHFNFLSEIEFIRRRELASRSG
jgi:hypothetical protein